MEWAEEQEGKEITESVVDLVVKAGKFIHMEYFDMINLSRAMWGFLTTA